MSDIIIEIIADTVNSNPHYQAILVGKRILEIGKAPTIRKEGTNLNGCKVVLLKRIEQI